MAIITTSWSIDFLLYIGLIVAAVYEFYRRKFQHWKTKNVPHSSNPVFPFGDLTQTSLAKKQIGEEIQEIYLKQRHLPYYGVWFLFRPTVLIMDPPLIKKIVISDFMHFHDHGMHYDEERDPLSGKIVYVSHNDAPADSYN
jgi:cytochrome P450 family 6